MHCSETAAASVKQRVTLMQKHGIESASHTFLCRVILYFTIEYNVFLSIMRGFSGPVFFNSSQREENFFISFDNITCEIISFISLDTQFRMSILERLEQMEQRMAEISNQNPGSETMATQGGGVESGGGGGATDQQSQVRMK